jgi:hypothetical protein
MTLIAGSSIFDVNTLILIVFAAAVLHIAYRICGVLADIHKTLAKPTQPTSQVSAPANSPTPAPTQTKAATTQDDGITSEIVAVIAAAVAATIGNNHRIVSIKPMNSSWERAGRQSVLTSHRIR